MREFNYKRAHKEWALPQFELLPQQVKDLYTHVQTEYADRNQNAKLGMDWLNPESQALFAAVPPEVLAPAAHVIYALGHWDYKDSGNPAKDNHGGYWKFELLAKQSLIERDAIRDYAKSAAPTDSFMDHKEGTDLDHEEIAQKLSPEFKPLFEVVKVMTVNHKPDPFCIGTKHFKTDSMYLDPRAAPCHTCGRPYDEHTYETAVLVRRLTSQDPRLTEPEQAKLKELVQVLTQYKIDGIAFTR